MKKVLLIFIALISFNVSAEGITEVFPNCKINKAFSTYNKIVSLGKFNSECGSIKRKENY